MSGLGECDNYTQQNTIQTLEGYSAISKYAWFLVKQMLQDPTFVVKCTQYSHLRILN